MREVGHGQAGCFNSQDRANNGRCLVSDGESGKGLGVSHLQMLHLGERRGLKNPQDIGGFSSSPSSSGSSRYPRAHTNAASFYYSSREPSIDLVNQSTRNKQHRLTRYRSFKAAATIEASTEGRLLRGWSASEATPSLNWKPTRETSMREAQHGLSGEWVAGGARRVFQPRE